MSPRRPVSGFGSVGSIPYSELLIYIDQILEIEDPEDRTTLIEFIEYLDSLFLQDVHKQQEQERRQQASHNSKKPISSSRPPVPR